MNESCYDISKYTHIYYPDFNRKYKQFANNTGNCLLKQLNVKVNKILGFLSEKMTQNGLNPQDQINEGNIIYETKPNQRKGITWSDAEYQHLGFQYVYIKVKSIQRFTENYNFLIRCYNNNVFQNISGKPVNIVSIGGGPGFELLAMRMFFNKYFKDTKITLTTIDLSDIWNTSNDILGIKFIRGSFYDPKIIKKINTYDISIMSYVFFHYFDKTGKYKLVNDMIKKKNKIMMINSRVKKMQSINYLQNNNLFIHRLIDHYDDRQTIISQNNLINNLKDRRCQLPFLDVPY